MVGAIRETLPGVAYHSEETYLVDKDGLLRETFIGPVEWDSPAVVDRLRRML